MKSTLCFHTSVQGHSHIIHGTECQDASRVASYPRWGCYVFATADGHGDPNCTRSAKGSAIAVDVALEVLKDLVRDYKDNSKWLLGTPEGNDLAREAGGRIVRRWRSRVLEDIQKFPVTQSELNITGNAAHITPEDNPERLYGTTLVAGALIPHALLLYQQGDGFCVVMNKSGAFVHPIPEDSRCQGNRTTSLCNEDAEQSIRSALIDLRGTEALACFVGSDGISGTFIDSEGLDNFCANLALELADKTTRADAEQVLYALLPAISEQGTGDDASIAGFVNTDLVQNIAEKLRQQDEEYRLFSELNAVQDKLVSMERLHDFYAAQSPEDADDPRKRELFLAEYDSLQSRANELSQLLSQDEKDATDARPTASLEPAPIPESQSKRKPSSKRAIEESVPIQKRRRTSFLPIVLVIVLALMLLGAGVLLGRTFFPTTANVETTVQEHRKTEHEKPNKKVEDVQPLSNREQTQHTKSWETLSELDVALPHAMSVDEQKLYDAMFGDAFVISDPPANTKDKTVAHTLYYKSVGEAYNQLANINGDPQFFEIPNYPFSVDELKDALGEQEIWRPYKWTSKEAEPILSKDLMEKILTDSGFSTYCNNLGLTVAAD